MRKKVDYATMHNNLIEFFGRKYWIEELIQGGTVTPTREQVEQWRDVFNGVMGDKQEVTINTFRLKTQSTVSVVMDIVRNNIP